MKSWSVLNTIYTAKRIRSCDNACDASHITFSRYIKASSTENSLPCDPSAGLMGSWQSLDWSSNASKLFHPYQSCTVAFSMELRLYWWFESKTFRALNPSEVACWSFLGVHIPKENRILKGHWTFGTYSTYSYTRHHNWHGLPNGTSTESSISVN